MTNPQDQPPSTDLLGRTIPLGIGTAVLGVVLFLIAWFVFGALGLANAPRLFAAMCLPPLVLAILFIGLYLRRSG